LQILIMLSHLIRLYYLTILKVEGYYLAILSVTRDAIPNLV